MRVLIIDDSKTMRNIHRSTLASLGFTQVEEAGNGQEGLEKAETFNPELILLDWNMPVMDGLTFAKTFRTKNKKTPIIMVTTEAEKARVVEAVKAGVNNYVVKPFTPASLGQKVSETVAKFSAAA